MAVSAADPAGRAVVSYAGPDQLWGEWLGEQLERLGYEVERRRWQATGTTDLAGLIAQARQSTDRLVAVFSSAYLHAGSPSPQVWRDAVGVALEHRELCVPVLVGRCDLPPRFWQLDPVDLHEVPDEQQARHRLLARLRPPQPRVAEAALAGQSLIRYPGRQPAVWSPRLPGRNPYFTGRDEMLQRIRSLLTADVTALIPHSLQGLGGVGKTQLAVEYAHRFAGDYDLVWWVPAGHVAEARAALAELAGYLDLPPADEVGQAVRAVLDALRTGDPYARWLLIFDSADRPAEIQPLLLSGPGQTLITSRNQEWDNRADSLDVDVYAREESLRFLRQRVPGITGEDAAALAAELGDLPLALEHAAAWLVSTGTAVDRYLQLLHTQAVSLFSALRPGGYRELVAVTWAVSLNQLREERPEAADLLNLCAFFDASPVPLDLLAQAPAQALPESLADVLGSDGPRAEAVRAIGRYSLARVAPGAQGRPYLSLHRLVQTLARQLLPAEQAAAYRAAAHLLLAAADPGDPLDSAHAARYAELLPHVLAAGVAESTEPQVRRLLLHVLSYLFVRGEYTAGLAAAQAARPVWQHALGQTHPDCCALARVQGNMLRSAGRLPEALEVDGGLYATLLDQLGPDDPLTVRAASGLAASHRRLGDFPGARKLDADALEWYRRHHGPDHEETLRAAHNVAVNLRMSGQFQAALELDRDTAQRWEREFGPDHLSTLFSRNNVARDLREVGDYYESVALEENVFARYAELFGRDAPDTLRAMKNLSLSRRKAGRYEESRALAEEVLVRHRRRFGELNPETLAATTNLANEHRLAGMHAAARGLAEEAATKYDAALGADHPFSACAAVNLAITLRLTGDPARARQVDERALARLDGALGAEHRYTLSCLVNLASDHSALGDLDRAAELGRQAVHQLRAAYGPGHPYTLAAALNLALDLRAQRQRDAYRELIEDTLSRYRTTLGPTHPETVAAEARTRADCDIEPPPT